MIFVQGGRWLRLSMLLAVCVTQLGACAARDRTSHEAVSEAPHITVAFNAYELLPATCEGVIIPGTLRVAKVGSTGVWWAMAAFEPEPACSHSLAPASAGGPPRPLKPEQIRPWGYVPQPTIGIFQRLLGQSWSMNQEGGRPFPCPAPGGRAPGPGNGALPPEVLRMWDLEYAPNCDDVVYPMRPKA